MQNEFMTKKEVADLIGIKERTLMINYAPQPDFPARISLSRKIYYWKREDIIRWMHSRKERRVPF